MARFAEDVARGVELEALGAERHALIEPHVVADDARFADHDTRTVVDAEIFADLGTGVYVDARGRVGRLGDQPREDRHAELQQGVREAVVGHGYEGRIAKDHLLVARGRRVAVEDGLHVGSEPAAQFGQQLQQLSGDPLAEPPGVRMLPAAEDGAGPGALASENGVEVAEEPAERFRVEIPGEDRRAEKQQGTFQFRGVDTRRSGRRDVGVRRCEGFDDPPEAHIGGCGVHRRISVLYSSKAYSRVER